jgi:hypothetical protein
MTNRRRERTGKHVSVGGAAADEVLAALVEQFSDRYTFIRELIQNSLDAGAARIDVRMAFAEGELRVEVQDDGEGMDRAIIEGYLLTLFRSTKEEDLTKIGKFGIGFTSIFAMEPEAVVVDTGRDGVWHRVSFDASRAYRLTRLADPYEGTTVTLRLPRGRAAAATDARAIRAAAERWCRYAEAAITTSAAGIDEPWPATRVAAAFGIDAPVTVTLKQDGVHAVLGVHPAAAPPVGYYNRGITLWEADEGAIPGVTFRVAGRHLEHTLTRDNVIRDRHYAVVLDAVREAARVQLGDAVHAEAHAAATARDAERAHALFGAIAEQVPWAWREDAPLLPGAAGPVSVAALRRGRGLLGRLTGATPTVWWAAPDCAIAPAVAAAGVHVVLATTADAAHLRWATRHLRGVPREVRSAWYRATPAEPGDAAALYAAAAAAGEALRCGHLDGGALAGRLAAALDDPNAVGEGDLPRPGSTLVVDPRHPLLNTLRALPPAVGGPLLAHAARTAAGLPTRPDHTADIVAAALGGAR